VRDLPLTIGLYIAAGASALTGAVAILAQVSLGMAAFRALSVFVVFTVLALIVSAIIRGSEGQAGTSAKGKQVDIVLPEARTGQKGRPQAGDK